MVESTYNWYRPVNGLMAAGFAVKLANTVAMKCSDGLKHSDKKPYSSQMPCCVSLSPRAVLSRPLGARLTPTYFACRLRLRWRQDPLTP